MLHDRELENPTSRQLRAQLLCDNDGDLRARLSVEYNDDWTNGINVVAEAGGQKGFRPWSTLRDFPGLTDIRQSIAVATGDRFNPGDTVPLTPMATNFVEGVGYEDTPANPAAATFTFDPGAVTNYEVGFDCTPVNAAGFASNLTLRLNYTYQDEFYWPPANLNQEDACGLLDGRISYAPMDGNWSFGVWGKNLADEEYRTNIIPFFGEEVSQYGAPRTYGVDFAYNFD